MNYYFSGMGFQKEEHLKLVVGKIPHRLLSCYEEYTNFAHKWCRLSVDEGIPKTTILLDSGAFTAWNKNREVTLDTLLPIYYDFMVKYWSSLTEIYLINLDKIPGSPGKNPSDEEIEDCIRISDANYNILVKEFGNRVLPVFHQGETESRLKAVCAMSDYICVSPRNDLWEGLRVKWSREVHQKIDRKIKTHGLATTGYQMMTTVPWYSVDSAAWQFLAGTGNISVVIGDKLMNVGVSSKSTKRFNAGEHINNMIDEYKALILKRINLYGIELEQVMEDMNYRMIITIMETQHWVDNCFKYRGGMAGGLFDL